MCLCLLTVLHAIPVRPASSYPHLEQVLALRVVHQGLPDVLWKSLLAGGKKSIDMGGMLNICKVCLWPCLKVGGTPCQTDGATAGRGATRVLHAKRGGTMEEGMHGVRTLSSASRSSCTRTVPSSSVRQTPSSVSGRCVCDTSSMYALLGIVAAVEHARECDLRVPVICTPVHCACARVVPLMTTSLNVA
jgi:hypothetical protein